MRDQDNFADGVASLYLVSAEKKLKMGVFLIEVIRNILVAFHLEPKTCNFFEISDLS